MTLTDIENTDATAAAEGSAPELRPRHFKVRMTEIPQYVPLGADIRIARKTAGSDTFTVTIKPSDGGQWGPEDLVQEQGVWVARNGSQCVTFVEVERPGRDLLEGVFSAKGCVFFAGGRVARRRGMEDPDVGVWGAESPPKLPGDEGES